MREEHLAFVSVVMPAFNVESFIAEAIDSVMQQNLPHMELLIVDDGSSDDTVKIVNKNIRRYGNRIRLFEQKNQGASAARNTAIRLAQGTLLAFLDSDDIWPDGIIPYHSEFMAENIHVPGIKGTISSFKHLNGSSRFEPTTASPPFVNSMMGALTVRKSVFDHVGMFDTTLSRGEDTDWYLRAEEMGIKFAQSERLSLYYRRRVGSLTDQSATSTSALMDVVRKKISRQREGKAGCGASSC